MHVLKHAMHVGPPKGSTKPHTEAVRIAPSNHRLCRLTPSGPRRDSGAGNTPRAAPCLHPGPGPEATLCPGPGPGPGPGPQSQFHAPTLSSSRSKPRAATPPWSSD